LFNKFRITEVTLMKIDTGSLTFVSQCQLLSSRTHVMDTLRVVIHVLKVRHSLKALMISKMF